MKTGIELITDERHRQLSQEGYTPEHDDQHNRGELSVAAAIYAAPGAAQGLGVGQRPRNKILLFWPWDIKWYKPTPQDRVRELTKAGALIAAEIDRLQRLSGTPA